MVAASGVGKFIEVMGASGWLDHNGTTYATAKKLGIRYDATVADILDTDTATAIDGITDKVITFVPTSPPPTVLPNLSIKVTADADATNNGGTIDIFVQYIIHTY